MLENIMQIIKSKEEELLIQKDQTEDARLAAQIIKQLERTSQWLSAAMIAAESLSEGQGKGRMPPALAEKILIIAAPHVERAAREYETAARAVARVMMKEGFILSALGILGQIGASEEDFPVPLDGTGLTAGIAIWLGARARALARIGKVGEVTKIALVLTKAIFGKEKVTGQEVTRALKGLGWFQGGQYVRAGWVTLPRVEKELFMIGNKNIGLQDVIPQPKQKKKGAKPAPTTMNRVGAKPAPTTMNRVGAKPAPTTNADNKGGGR